MGSKDPSVGSDSYSCLGARWVREPQGTNWSPALAWPAGGAGERPRPGPEAGQAPGGVPGPAERGGGVPLWCRHWKEGKMAGDENLLRHST